MDCNWRCAKCTKLLGIVRAGRLHLRFVKGHEYIVALLAIGTCRSCSTLNELRGMPGIRGVSTKHA